jgi:hypothetical protein
MSNQNPLIVVERRKIRRNTPPVLHQVSAGNCTNPETKEQFVREAMQDYAMQSKSVLGILRMMGELRGK